jgi:hypothetical protein
MGKLDGKHALVTGGGNLDVLVANAGSGFPAAILQADAAAWDFRLRLNVTGSALCFKHAGWITGQVFGVDGGLKTPVMPSMAAMAKLVYGEALVAEMDLPDLTALSPAKA